MMPERIIKIANEWLPDITLNAITAAVLAADTFFSKLTSFQVWLLVISIVVLNAARAYHAFKKKK